MGDVYAERAIEVRRELLDAARAAGADTSTVRVLDELFGAFVGDAEAWVRTTMAAKDSGRPVDLDGWRPYFAHAARRALERANAAVEREASRAMALPAARRAPRPGHEQKKGTNTMTVFPLSLDRLSSDLDPHYKDLIEGIAGEEGYSVRKIQLSTDHIHVEVVAGSGEDARTLGPVVGRLKTRMESAIMSKPAAPASTHIAFNNYGQAGAMGPNASASNNSFQQIAGDPTTTAQLLEQLETLFSQTRKSDAPPEALEAVMQAKVEAKAGRFGKALEFLGAQAKALVPVAGQAAFKMLTDGMRQHLGLPPST